jgi:protein-tyrosine phosphatase
MGSKPEIGRAVGEAGFDLLVLCAEEYQPPAWQFPGVEVIHAPFDDNDHTGPLAGEKKIARSAAKQVALALRNRANVLVTCYAGRNRSGLVSGLALVENDHDPVRAIYLIQGRRTKALTNQHFVDLIAGS